MQKTRNRLFLLAALLGAACAPAGPPAQAPAPVPQDTATRHLLRPVPVPASVRAAEEAGTRSPTGAPGERYWQQEVSYDIHAELDPRTALLSGRERIVYRNNAPVPVSSVVLNLHQNVFREDVPRNRFAPNTGGVTLERVAVQGRELPAVEPAEICRRGVRGAECVMHEPAEGAPLGYAVQGTLARLVLPRPIAPGDSAVLEVAWRHRVPPEGTFRTAYQDALGGRAFQVAQWYPQVAVFDDVRGWDATPYLGDGEFYLEYGDFDVSLTLPEGWLVGASGVLQNPEEVLAPEARARLAAALETDGVTAVVTEADLAAGTATRAAPGKKLTWRFRAEDVRDFAFATSDRYVWDVARAEVPDGEGTRLVPVHALYRPGAPGWEEAARYGEHSLELLSRRLVPYPYPQITIAEGSVGGMEYPQLMFIGKPRTAKALYGVIAHEMAHEWFPMLVGSDEAAYAWMDEGLSEYYESVALADFFPGTDPYAEDLAAYLAVAGTEREVPLMRHTDLVGPYGDRRTAAYYKPAVLLRTLRGVLGDSVFDRAIRTYAEEWSYRHPTPWDFFNTVERVAGRDLDWFFYPWWFETGTLDYAVTGVETGEDGTLEVTLRDLGDIPAPVKVVVVTEGGGVVEVEVPMEVWSEDRLRTAVLTLPMPAEPVQVVVDPELVFPDVNPENNVWTAPGR